MSLALQIKSYGKIWSVLMWFMCLSDCNVNVDIMVGMVCKLLLILPEGFGFYH